MITTNPEPWRNFISPQQVADELKRFISSTESLQTSSNIQIRYHGVSLSEIAGLLQRVKEQIIIDSKYQNVFAGELVGPPHHGVDLLIRTLSILQQQLYEASQQQGRLANILHRNSSNKKRKAGDAEADCLEILKLLLRRTKAWKTILEHVIHVETILISISSPQLDSKCYALEINTLLLDYPDGFLLIYKALTSLAGKKRDDSRLSLLIAQLPLGLNLNKLHLQVLILRFLNKLLLTAPTTNHRVIMQCEAEIAGFSAERVEKIAQDFSKAQEADLLAQELMVWRQYYFPIAWLEQRAFEHQRGVSASTRGGNMSAETPIMKPVPSSIDDRSHYLAATPGGYRRPDPRNTSMQSNYSTTTDSEATLTRPKSERKRLFGPSPKSKTSRTSPGTGRFERHRNRRGQPPSSLVTDSPRLRRSYYESSGPEEEPSYVSARKLSEPNFDRYGASQSRSRGPTVYFNDQYSAPQNRQLHGRSVTPDPKYPVSERHNAAPGYQSRTLERSMGVGGNNRYYDDDDYNYSRGGRRLAHQARHSSSMHQLNEIGKQHSGNGRKYSVEERYSDDPRRRGEHSVPIRLENGGRPRRHRRVHSLENLVDIDKREESPLERRYAQGTREIPIQKQSAPQMPVQQRHPQPVSRQLPGEIGMSALRRSRSDMGDRQRMQGFSYLYPSKPVVDKISPVPTNESSRDSGWAEQTPPVKGSVQFVSSPSSSSGGTSKVIKVDTGAVTQSQPTPHGHVTYIPIRVEGEQAIPEQSGVRTRNRQFYDDSSARSSITTGADSALESSIGYPRTGSSLNSEPSPTRHHGGRISSSANQPSYMYGHEQRGFRRPEHDARIYDQRRYTDTRRSAVPDDVEDALRKFDYLNDYSVDDRSSSYAAFNR